MKNNLSMTTGPWSKVEWHKISISEIDTLVAQGADVNQTEIQEDNHGRKIECNPLFCAIISNSKTAVVGLLRNKANPNAELVWNSEKSPKIRLIDKVDNPFILECMLYCGGKISPSRLNEMCRYFLTNFSEPSKKELGQCLQVVLTHYQSDSHLKQKLLDYITHFKDPSTSNAVQKNIEKNKRQLTKLLTGGSKKTDLTFKKISKNSSNQHH